jgi:hypothetical protein
VGQQHPKDVTRVIARDLSGIVGELAALKADAHQWLVGPEYEALRLRLEATHAAAAEAAVVEARRQVRMDERRL